MAMHRFSRAQIVSILLQAQGGFLCQGCIALAGKVFVGAALPSLR
jgi:hypothetical protein